MSLDRIIVAALAVGIIAGIHSRLLEAQERESKSEQTTIVQKHAPTPQSSYPFAA